MFERLGAWARNLFSLVGDLGSMLIGAGADSLLVLRHGRAAVWMVLQRQIYFTGLEAARIIIIISLVLGTIIIAQVVSLAGHNGSLSGKILVWVVLRELAPLLTAIIVIARSGTAIATELGAMKINGEITSIEMMGIPAPRYLILPRITGVTLSVLVLTVYFVLTAFAGGFLMVSTVWHLPFDQFMQGILSALGLKELLIVPLKSILFGLAISSICCRYGLSVGTSSTEIPQAATKAVMASLMSVFVLDGLITYLSSIAL